MTGWAREQPPTAVLVRGPEELLAERAVSATLRGLRETAPELEVIRLSAAGYQPGELATHTGPSLFGGDKAVVVERLDEASDELIDDLTDYLQMPADDVTLVVTHSGAQRGKRAIDALVKVKARVIECPAIKTDCDKTDFVVNEFRRQGRKATPEAVRALVEALGRDTRELASAVAQLVEDTEGVVDDRVVEIYHGGKVEATGFRVADAAVAGQTGERSGCCGTPSPRASTRYPSLRSSPRSCAGWSRSARPVGAARNSWPSSSGWRPGRSTRPSTARPLDRRRARPGHPGGRRG